MFSTRLLTNDIYDNFISINFSPFKTPYVPGLHGFKNAINNEHLGFSAHIIDNSIDQGKLLSTMIIKPFPKMKTFENYCNLSTKMCSLMILNIISKINENRLNFKYKKNYVSSSLIDLEAAVLKEI